MKCNEIDQENYMDLDQGTERDKLHSTVHNTHIDRMIDVL